MRNIIPRVHSTRFETDYTDLFIFFLEKWLDTFLCAWNMITRFRNSGKN